MLDYHKEGETMRIQANSKLVMIGDSITDSGRTYPIGQGYQGGLGTGYPSLVHGYLETTYPERQIQTINMGISGNTSKDLEARWQTDLMDLNPDWVSILIGINDVWQKTDYPDQKQLHISPGEYKTSINRMVEKAKSAGINVVLMTPFLVESNKEDVMRQYTEEYVEICKEIAKNHQITLVDLQGAVDQFLELRNGEILSEDRVHPNFIGHMMIAKGFLEAVKQNK